MKPAKPKRKRFICPHPTFHFVDPLETALVARCQRKISLKGCHRDAGVDYYLDADEAVKEVRRRWGQRFCGLCLLICAPTLFLLELEPDWRPSEPIAEDFYTL